MNVHDLVIVGGGPGGYTAALYAARAGLRTVVLEKLSAGGQMAMTSQLDNYPGFPDGVDGFELAEKMQAQAEKFGAKTEYAQVNSLHLSPEIKKIETSEGEFYARAVIVATGADPRPLGLHGEKALTGRGVHYCAACDGMRYRGKVVAVVGGGNSAVGDALSLSRTASQVYLIHRRDSLRADKIYHEALEKAENIQILWDSAVTALDGEASLRGIKVENLKNGERQEIFCDGLFVSIGRKPASDLVAGQLALDSEGYIVADESTRTSQPRVYAVGDVRTKEVRQVVTAIADGAAAVHHAQLDLGSK